GRQAALDLCDLFLHAGDDGGSALAIAHGDDAAHHLAAILFQGAAAKRRAERDLAEIAQAADQADAAHDDFHSILLDHLAADVVVAARDSFHHGVQGDAVGAELAWIEIDLIFAHEAADRSDLGDSGHGVELVADEPV